MSLVSGLTNKRENKKPYSGTFLGTFLCSLQALFLRIFQASEGKREASEERQTRPTGKGARACPVSAVSSSPEKREKKRLFSKLTLCGHLAYQCKICKVRLDLLVFL